MNLREIRVAKKLTQYELADLSGISQNYISELEQEKHEATETVILDLCKALEVDPNTLLDWE
ncbi:MAG: helix-turn-helix domain-containing protein [Clostridium sp.]